jgi:hypothetical protein
VLPQLYYAIADVFFEKNGINVGRKFAKIIKNIEQDR